MVAARLQGAALICLLAWLLMLVVGALGVEWSFPTVLMWLLGGLLLVLWPRGSGTGG